MEGGKEREASVYKRRERYLSEMEVVGEQERASESRSVRRQGEQEPSSGRVGGCVVGLEEPESGYNVKHEDCMCELPGIPSLPSLPNPQPGVIFVLEKASLVPAYVGRVWNSLFFNLVLQ